MKRIALALFLAATPLLASAQFLNGNELLTKCTSPDAIQRMDCLGYVSGVTDTLATVTVCPPQGVSRGQVQDMVVQFLSSVPAERHRPADVLVGSLLSSTWPCKRNQQPARSL